VGKSGANRPLGRPTHGWKGKIIKDPKWEGVDSIYLVQDTDQQQDLDNMVINLHVP